MARRPTMDQRYEGEWGKKWGKGTVVVHYLKEKEWFLETALAFLGAGNVGGGAGGEGGGGSSARTGLEIEGGPVAGFLNDHGGALRRDEADATPEDSTPPPPLVNEAARIKKADQYPPEVDVRRLGDDV